MTITLLILGSIVRVFMWFLWGRLIIDWMTVLAPGFRPKGFVLVLCEVVATVTDPPLKLVRKLVRPISLGLIRIDFAWILLMVLCAFLSYVLSFLTFSL